MKERYNIEIADIQLTILSDEPEEYVASTVAQLDALIRDMTVKNKRCSKLDAAILCALDFYSEKIKSDKKIKNLEAQISLYEANIRRLKEEAEQLRAAAVPADKTEEPNAEEEKPAPAEKAAKSVRRTEQLSIPDVQSAPADKVREIENLLRPHTEEAKNVEAAPSDTRENKLKQIENLLRRSGGDAQ